MYQHFTTAQITPLIISGVILILSVVFIKKNTHLGLGLLFIGTLVLGYFIANLDPFLILWDEQYHALVAKNMSNDFFKPMLYCDPVLDFDFENWAGNSIWLHKQPLFLWQMAVSIKLFGTTEMAVRLPSILMHAIIPLFIYRIGSISINQKTGYFGALLFAVAYFPLELTAGRFSTDHNDIAFLFYVTASFWAWFEYYRTKKMYWLILIGLFSGCAVLVKWLMGLLIYVIWTITIVISETPTGIKIRSYFPVVLSGIISLIVFLPWQIYIHWMYPNEAAHEARLNSKHFFEPVEGHAQSTWYHFTDGLEEIYGTGDLLPFILLAGLVLLVINVPNKKHKILIASTVVFVYLFYTVASTKMISFPIIAAPLIYLGLGYIIYAILSFIEKKVKIRAVNLIISFILPISLAFSALNLTQIQNYHTISKRNENRERTDELIEVKFIQSLDKKLGNENYVIFNAILTGNGHIPIMFYTDHVAYNIFPSPAQIEKMQREGRKIAVLNLGTIPDYILEDEKIELLEIENKEFLSIYPKPD